MIVESKSMLRRHGRWLALFSVLGLFVAGCDGGSDGDPDIATVKVSGTVTDTNDDPLAGVAVKAITVLAGQDLPGTPVTTDAAGQFTLEVAKDFTAYYEYSMTGRLTVNTQFESHSADVTGLEMQLLTEVEANSIIDTAYPGLTIADGAWLAISVEDGAGEVNGATVTVDAQGSNPSTTECDGTLTGTLVTVAPCNMPDRVGPMYLDYYDTEQVVGVTVTGIAGTTTAPVRDGEATVLIIK